MTTEKAMPKRHTGVHTRAGSTFYQWRIKVPLDLQSEYPSQWAHRCSLGTSDLREANAKAAQLQAQWTSRFEDQRRELNPQRLDRITPEMATLMAETLLHISMAADEKLRTDPAEQQWLTRWLEAMGKGSATEPHSPLDGMPDILADHLAELHLEQAAQVGTALARGRLRRALPGMQFIGRKLGLAFDENTPGVREALQVYLSAMREVAEAKVKRDRGELVPTPRAASTQATAKQHLLSDVFDRWKAAKPRGKDAIATCERALKLFEQQTGNPPLAQLTRAQGVEFMGWLQTLGTASKTSSSRLTYVKSLLGFAERDLEWIPKNPWRGLDIKYTTETKRRPWTSGQIKAFFSLPLFTKYELSNDWKAGADASYWVPLLGLYTGARIGELAQLHTADVFENDGQHFLRISDAAEGAQLKTDASNREVPLHSELVRLGFLDYAAAMKAAGHERLWPKLKLRNGKPGGYLSDWFGKMRKEVPDTPDFHSLRHTVRSKMTEAQIEEAVQDRITGHEVGGSTGTRVYSHPTAILRTAVESIRYPSLNLPRVYESSKS